MRDGSYQKRRPNWLFRGLLVVSFAIHILVFLHVTGVYRSSALTYIELTVQDLSQPPARDIPRPRPRPKTTFEPSDIKKLQVTQRPLPSLNPIKMEPTEADLPDNLVERISVPDLPVSSGLHVTAWNPGDLAQDGMGDYATSGSYLDMVRLKIESRKEYPDLARTGQMEGSVTVRFIITPEGGVRTVEVAKSSTKNILDAAALRAVKEAAPFPKPPSSLFKGDIPLEITIVFELT